MIHDGLAGSRVWSLLAALLTAALVILFAMPRAALAGGGSSPDSVLLADAIERFDAHAFFPLPGLGPAELDALAKGELVRVRESPAEPGAPQRVTGLRWLDLPRPLVWVACQDPHFGAVDELDEHRLDGVEPGGELPSGGHGVWYGLIDLPWPFRNRQWVIEVWDNYDLVRHTGGQSWEHVWRLERRHLPAALGAIARGEVAGVTPQRAARAIVTPVNQGAWVAIEVAGGTLLGWHATSSIGGSVNDRLVVSHAFRSLERLFRGVERRARRKVRRHYRGDHPPVEGGDGIPLPLYPD